MANYNKLSQVQKDVMAEFMGEHPNLAKNLLPNCGQGKATSNKLWEELAKKLNAVGPPIKNAKMWKKAYADQKYQAKKKLSFNKASRKKTGGGLYEEKLITLTEERLIEAAGLEICVEGNKEVPAFGSKRPHSSPVTAIHQDGSDSDTSEKKKPNYSGVHFVTDGNGDESNKTPQKMNAGPKLLLLQQNIKASNDMQQNMDTKFGRLVEIQERLLRIKEEKHSCYMAIIEVKLQIKTLELEMLKQRAAK